jgi:hypothetical protein
MPLEILKKRPLGSAPDQAPSRSLAPSVTEALAAFSRIEQTPDDAGVARIEVHETVSNAAWAYERLRNAIDYQDEHLLRKNAVERNVRRRLVPGVTAEEVAEALVYELIRGRYLPNNQLPITIVGRAAGVLRRYLALLEAAPADARDQLREFWIGILSVELAELLAPVEREEALGQLMFRVIHRDIPFAQGVLDPAEQNVQISIAIHRALLKSDANIIRYHLFLHGQPGWRTADPATVARIGRELPQIRERIESQLTNPVGGVLQRIVKRYAIIFWMFDDLVRLYGSSAGERLMHPDRVAVDLSTVYAERRHAVQRKIARSTLRSIVYVFLTKMLIALILEFPLDRLLSATGRVGAVPLIINIGFPPFLLLMIGITNGAPGRKNLEALVAKVQDLLYRGDEPHVLVKPRSPIRRNAVFTAFYRLLYGFAFVTVFGLLIWGLMKLQFTPVSIFIFLLFLTIVSFFGIRVRILARELLVVDQRENIFTVLFDFFTVPILQVGRWISLRVPRVNVLLFVFDIIIEAPFKTFLEAAEGFFGFLKEKREEIV